MPPVFIQYLEHNPGTPTSRIWECRSSFWDDTVFELKWPQIVTKFKILRKLCCVIKWKRNNKHGHAVT